MTAPIPRVHLLRGSGRLGPLADSIEHIVTGALAQIAKQLPLAAVDIVVRDDPYNTIPELGIGGFTPDAHTVLVGMDPSAASIGDIEQSLPGLLAHELHHAARWIDPGYGTTLFDAVITEGLADHFAVELFSEDPPLWAIANSSALEQLAQKSGQALSDEHYIHEDWFFGSEKQSIPRWAGYSLGWSLVGHWLGTAPGRTAASAVTEPSTSFRASWKALFGELPEQAIASSARPE